jgi:hypothetical protein
LPLIPAAKFRHSVELNGATKAALNSPQNELRTQRLSRRKRAGAPVRIMRRPHGLITNLNLTQFLQNAQTREMRNICEEKKYYTALSM